jgi:hypothetical protein
MKPSFVILKLYYSGIIYFLVCVTESTTEGAPYLLSISRALNLFLQEAPYFLTFTINKLSYSLSEIAFTFPYKRNESNIFKTVLL